MEINIRITRLGTDSITGEESMDWDSRYFGSIPEDAVGTIVEDYCSKDVVSDVGVENVVLVDFTDPVEHDSRMVLTYVTVLVNDPSGSVDYRVEKEV